MRPGSRPWSARGRFPALEALLSTAAMPGPRLKELRAVREMPIHGLDLSRMSGGAHLGHFTPGGFTTSGRLRTRAGRMKGVSVVQNRADSSRESGFASAGERCGIRCR